MKKYRKQKGKEKRRENKLLKGLGRKKDGRTKAEEGDERATGAVERAGSAPGAMVVVERVPDAEKALSVPDAVVVVERAPGPCAAK